MFGERPVGTGGLKAAARSGSKWSALQGFGARFLTILVFLVLARMLTPSDFGVVALAMVFVALLQVLVEGGFSQAIIQRRQLLPGHVDTVFWMSVTVGIALAAVLVAVAGPLGRAFGEPQLTPVLRVLAIALIASALGATQSALLRRNLRFKPLAVRAVVSNTVGGISGLVAAFAGWGVWALVLQYLLLCITQTVVLWTATGWRPGRDISRAYFRDLFGFSRNSLGISLLQFTNQRSDDFLIGSFLGSVALGIYTVAYRLLRVMSELINHTMLTVAFPVFSRLQDDLPGLMRAYRSVLGVVAAVAFPAYLFFVVAAPDITSVFFGPQWEEAAPVMRVLALAGALQVINAVTDSCLSAIGKSHIVFRNRLAVATVQLIGFIIAVRFGIIWVAVALAARAYLMAPLPVWSLRRAGVTSLRSWASALVIPVGSTLVMLAAMQGALLALPDGVAPAVRLAVIVPVALLVYLTMLWTFDRRVFTELLSFVGRRPRRGRTSERRARRVGSGAIPVASEAEA